MLKGRRIKEDHVFAKGRYIIFFTSTVDDNTKQILETTVQTWIGDDTRYVQVLRMKTYATREHVGYDCRLTSTYAYHMFMHQDEHMWFVHWF